MGKPQNKGQVELLTGKLDAATATVRRLEADVAKLQRRLFAKAKEVNDARQARKEALTLLNMAATDPAVRDRAIALLAADAMNEQQVAALAAADAVATNTTEPAARV